MSWKEKARQHWKEHRPAMFQELQKSGRLETELESAANLANEEIGELVENGLDLLEAHEIVLPKYIYLKPEQEEPMLGESLDSHQMSLSMTAEPTSGETTT